MLKQARSENQEEQVAWTIERMTSALDRLDRVLDDYGSASRRATPGHTTDPTPFLIEIAEDLWKEPISRFNWDPQIQPDGPASHLAEPAR